MTNEAPRTVQQTAAALNVSVHTIRAWVARRKIEALYLGRAVRVPVSEINRLLTEGRVPAIREQ